MKNEFLRYSCQIALPQFKEQGQIKLRNAKVLIVGAGGLGCPAAQYLVAAGVGTVTIADDDVVSIGNLHRQILYNADEVGQKKAVLASKKLSLQNPQIEVIGLDLRVTSHNVIDIVKNQDIVIDGTDNFETRYLLNDACVLTQKPLIHGAIYQYEGQVAVWNARNSDNTFSPNLRDIFPEVDAASVPNCAEGGVIPTLAGIIGCMQANETIKMIIDSPEILKSKLLIFNANSLSSTIINLGPTSHTIIKDLQPTIEIPAISVTDFKNQLNAFDVIDVRTNEERNDFNIGGTHVPLAEINYSDLASRLTKPVVFICASGKRSAEAVKNMLKIDTKAEVFSLSGGLKAYKESDV